MAENLLPEGFEDLEPHVARWDLLTTNARYQQRLSSSMADMEAFNDAIVANAERVKQYLDSKPFADYSDQDNRLTRLMLAFTLVAQAVQIYKRPDVPDSGSVNQFDMVIEPWTA